MHPAFSVIFFTTASGAGFGLFAWMGFLAFSDQLPGRVPAVVALLVGAIFAAVGLLSSVAHLGQPTRAWRAFSQWRSSWLSREGIVAVATFLPAVWLGVLVWQGNPQSSRAIMVFPQLATFAPIASTAAMQVAGAALLLLAIATTCCTAMIYASLKPIPAWSHPLVLPVYLVFSLYTGGLLYLAANGTAGHNSSAARVLLIACGGALLWLLKYLAWRRIDSGTGPVDRNSALGLPHGRPVQVFERPHTEANYLLKEMGYVLARKHARKLRVISMILLVVAPMLCVLPTLGSLDGGVRACMAFAFTFALAGALVERWLFFAEARHLVTLYY